MRGQSITPLRVARTSRPRRTHSCTCSSDARDVTSSSASTPRIRVCTHTHATVMPQGAVACASHPRAPARCASAVVPGPTPSTPAPQPCPTAAQCRHPSRFGTRAAVPSGRHHTSNARVRAHTPEFVQAADPRPVTGSQSRRRRSAGTRIRCPPTPRAALASPQPSERRRSNSNQQRGAHVKRLLRHSSNQSRLANRCAQRAPTTRAAAGGQQQRREAHQRQLTRASRNYTLNHAPASPSTATGSRTASASPATVCESNTPAPLAGESTRFLSKSQRERDIATAVTCTSASLVTSLDRSEQQR